MPNSVEGQGRSPAAGVPARVVVPASLPEALKLRDVIECLDDVKSL